MATFELLGLLLNRAGEVRGWFLVDWLAKAGGGRARETWLGQLGQSGCLVLAGESEWEGGPVWKVH